jgi:hypothetical protein
MILVKGDNRKALQNSRLQGFMRKNTEGSSVF